MRIRSIFVSILLCFSGYSRAFISALDARGGRSSLLLNSDIGSVTDDDAAVINPSGLGQREKIQTSTGSSILSSNKYQGKAQDVSSNALFVAQSLKGLTFYYTSPYQGTIEYTESGIETSIDYQSSALGLAKGISIGKNLIGFSLELYKDSLELELKRSELNFSNTPDENKYSDMTNHVALKRYRISPSFGFQFHSDRHRFGLVVTPFEYALSTQVDYIYSFLEQEIDATSKQTTTVLSANQNFYWKDRLLSNYSIRTGYSFISERHFNYHLSIRYSKDEMLNDYSMSSKVRGYYIDGTNFFPINQISDSGVILKDTSVLTFSNALEILAVNQTSYSLAWSHSPRIDNADYTITAISLGSVTQYKQYQVSFGLIYQRWFGDKNAPLLESYGLVTAGSYTF